MAPTLIKIAGTADQGGFDLIGVMDHFFQIEMIGLHEREMLEANTTLVYLAANDSRAPNSRPRWAASRMSGR